MADPQRKWVSDDVLTTYAYLLLYISLSSGQIFFNKWVLSSKEINFPYPLGLTLLHMVFSSVLCFVLTKVLKILKVEEGMTLDIYISSVIPIGAMFALTLWLGNTAYLCSDVESNHALCLLVPWIFLEKPKMDEQRTWSFQPLILTLNSLCTFALNLSVFLVIQHTSALTIRVAGVVKDWVVVLLSALLFADAKLTLINLFGYAIAIAGVAAYDNHKLKKGTSQASSDESEPTKSVRLIQSSDSYK
ncbi:unnamed protein product [Withania somnifera]